MTAENGTRVGEFVVLVDHGSSRRHLLKPHSVLGLSDSDECKDSTIITLTGGQCLIVAEPLDRVMTWF